METVRVSTCKTFQQNQNFDLTTMIPNIISRMQVVDGEGVFTASVRCIFEIDDTEFLPKQDKIRGSRKLITTNISPSLEPNNIIISDDDDDIDDTKDEVITTSEEKSETPKEEVPIIEITNEVTNLDTPVEVFEDIVDNMLEEVKNSKVTTKNKSKKSK